MTDERVKLLPGDGEYGHTMYGVMELMITIASGDLRATEKLMLNRYRASVTVGVMSSHQVATFVTRSE